jgi:VanZ family protein
VQRAEEAGKHAVKPIFGIPDLQMNHASVFPGERRRFAWFYVALWCAVIFTFSTSWFSAANTARLIGPIIQFFAPDASPSTVALVHLLVRKSAHFTEYGVLFWLLVRGPMRGRPYVALGICVLYAMFDEGHQMFVPGRTPSLYDVALDSTGALFSRFLNAAVS